jgi:hypothetical protein
MKQAENDDYSFKSWLLSKREWVEKTVGAVVLTVEIIGLLGEVYHGVSQLILSQILNFFFLIFIYFYLKNDFAKRFSVNADDPVTSSPKRGAAITRVLP